MEKKLYKLKIDPEFESYFPPLPKVTYNELEFSINRDGCIEPLSIWQGIILDGHNRYHICHDNNIPFEYIELELENREQAKLWMLRKQNARRSIPVFQRCELAYEIKATILEEVEQKRREAISNYRQTGVTGPQSQRTSERLAEYALVSDTTWKRANFIIENADESLKEQVRTRRLSIKKAYNMLRANSKEEMHNAFSEFEDDDYDENEDQRLHEMIRAMPKENTTDPRADAVIKDEGEIPVKRIGGYEPAVYQEAPILMSSEEPQRIPGDFYYVEEQTKYSMRTMLDNLKIGLYWLRDEDCNRRDEILSIVEEGFNDAKKLIEQETRR